MKKCVDCGKQYNPKGTQKRCVDCGKAYWKAYNKAYKKEYRQTQRYKDRAKEYYKKYYQTEHGKNKMKVNAKAYQQKNKYKAYRKEYEQTPARKEYKKVLKNKRSSRKRLLPNTLTVVDWCNAIKYFCHSCAYCGEYSQELQQEHFIPVASGGGYTPDNIVPACSKCNLQKHVKTARDFLEEIGHVEKYEIIVSYLQSRHR